MVRIMEGTPSADYYRGPYYRVSIPEKQTFTVTGEVSTNPALTHIPITESSAEDILRIIESITGGG